MNIIDYYRQIREDIASEKFDTLQSYPLEKPVYFNWVQDIFKPLNVDNFHDQTALIWRSEDSEKYYTFQEIYELSNQLLNFVRKKWNQRK